MLFAQAATVSHRSLEPVDIAIIAVYFVIIRHGFYFARRDRTSEDYFLASRNVAVRLGASLFVSNLPEPSSDWPGRWPPPDWPGHFEWRVAS